MSCRRWSFGQAQAAGVYVPAYTDSTVPELPEYHPPTFESSLETWNANEYYAVRLNELTLLAPAPVLSGHLEGNAYLSLKGPAPDFDITYLGPMRFVLHEVTENGTDYLKLSSSETYWLSRRVRPHPTRWRSLRIRR